MSGGVRWAMAHHKESVAATPPPERTVEHFSVPSQILRTTQTLRVDASHFDPAVARALEALRHSGMDLKTLGSVTSRVFIPNRFKRIYVTKEYGLPFLQGSHIVHFQPADVKFVSRTAHRHIDNWVIKEGWILVTRSGTVGRVALCPPEWDGWAASEHILRVVPKDDVCPSGYLFTFLASDLGCVQLAHQIYGAVVDELTEDQVRNVVVPLPRTHRQRKLVEQVNKDAHEALMLRSRAVGIVTKAAEDISVLVNKDRHDATVAERRKSKRGRPPTRQVEIHATADQIAKAIFAAATPPDPSKRISKQRKA